MPRSAKWAGSWPDFLPVLGTLSSSGKGQFHRPPQRSRRARALSLDFEELMDLTGRLGDKAKRYAQEEPAAAALLRKLSDSRAGKAELEKLHALADQLTKKKRR